MLLLKKILILLLLISISFSCKNNNRDKVELEKRFNEVMVIHDEIMPDMSKISRYRRQLKTWINIDTTGMNDSLRVAINSNIDALNIADEAMMQWMHEFKKPSADQSFTEKSTFYDSEMDKIEGIKSLFVSSIESANKLLKHK